MTKSEVLRRTWVDISLDAIDYNFRKIKAHVGKSMVMAVVKADAYGHGAVPVAKAIEECINEYYPGTEVHIEHAEGLDECRKVLMLAKAGRKNGCLIEGMGCPGGCVAGAGTNIPINKASAEVAKFVNETNKSIPDKDVVKNYHPEE